MITFARGDGLAPLTELEPGTFPPMPVVFWPSTDGEAGEAAPPVNLAQATAQVRTTTTQDRPQHVCLLN